VPIMCLLFNSYSNFQVSHVSLASLVLKTIDTLFRIFSDTIQSERQCILRIAVEFFMKDILREPLKSATIPCLQSFKTRIKNFFALFSFHVLMFTTISSNGENKKAHCHQTSQGAIYVLVTSQHAVTLIFVTYELVSILFQFSVKLYRFFLVNLLCRINFC
jgi:hypothetical protein